MKKLLKATLLLAALTVYTSCSDDNDLKDPSERLSEATTKYMDVLTAAPNGWAMTMYGDLDFGGFNVLCKFEKNGKVTIANEKFAADTTAVSHFKLEQSSGVVLSFDEYCELFHYFSDPVNNDGYNSQTENGFGADLEFRIISASADSVVMRGKKHDTKIVMTPLTDDTTEITDSVWAKYLREVAAVAKVMQKGSYHMILGNDSIKMKANRRNRVLSYTTTDEEGNRLTKKLPYIITPNGITLYETFNFKGEKVNGFRYASDTDTYKQEGTGNITLEKFTPTLCEQLVDGIWYLTTEELGSFAKPRWNQFRNGLLSFGKAYNQELVIRYAVFGTMRNRFGLTVGPVDKASPYSVFVSECYFDYKEKSNDEIEVWFNGEFDELGNAEVFYPNKDGARMQYAVQTFGESKTNSRTFKIETDNIKEPTYLKLIDQKTSGNYMKLMAEPVYFPFGDGPEQQ